MPAAIKCSVVLALAGLIQVRADDRNGVENKNVTVISGQSSADGNSEVRREVTQNCIVSLPDPDQLEPQVTSQPVYLREINGDANHSDWAKAYTATLDVNYLTSEKEVLIITTRSVQAQAPVLRDVEKTLRHAENFVSDPSEGSTYAGGSNRQYYFTSRADAIKDVRERAKAWIQEQKSVLCNAK